MSADSTEKRLLDNFRSRYVEMVTWWILLIIITPHCKAYDRVMEIPNMSDNITPNRTSRFIATKSTRNVSTHVNYSHVSSTARAMRLSKESHNMTSDSTLTSNRSYLNKTATTTTSYKESRNSSDVGNATTTKPTNKGVGSKNGIIHITSIKGICRAFGIPLENCTCVNFPHFCIPFGGSEKPQPVTRYVYNRVNTHWYAAVGSIAAFIGIIVNLGVLVVSIEHRKTLARSNLLVALLSLFDCISCVFQFLGTIYLFWTIEWPYGLAMCKLIRGSDIFGSFVAVEIMLLIAIERFVGIMFPFQNKFSMNNVMKVLVCLAILCCIASLIPLLMVVVLNKSSGRCIDTWRGTEKAVIYEWFIMGFFFLLPVLVIFIVYGAIMRYLSKQMASSVINTQYQMKQRIRRNRRVMCLLLAILVAFIFLTLPNRAVNLYIELKDGPISKRAYTILMFISFVTYPLHPVVNPFIYSLVDKDFRNKLKDMTVRRLTTRVVKERRRTSTVGTSF